MSRNFMPWEARLAYGVADVLFALRLLWLDDWWLNDGPGQYLLRRALDRYPEGTNFIDWNVQTGEVSYWSGRRRNPQ